MKLYATVSSERASKGQGGNTRLTIIVSGTEGEQLAVINVFPPNDLVSEAQMTTEYGEGIVIHNPVKTKGEKQKGEPKPIRPGTKLYKELRAKDEGNW